MIRRLLPLALMLLIAVLAAPDNASAQNQAKNSAKIPARINPLPMAIDYCAAFPKGRTFLLLVDQTAPYSQEDAERLQRGVNKLLGMLNKSGDRLVIHTISDYISTSSELLHECVPGCPDGEKCRSSVLEADKAKIRNAIISLVENEIPQMARATKEESAIAEVIYATVNRYRPDILAIFSDFLEYHGEAGNLPAASFYSDDKKKMAEYLAALRGKARLIPDFAPHLRVIGFGWSKELQTASLDGKGRQPQGTTTFSKNLTPQRWRDIREFWIKYFEGENRSISIELEFLGVAAPPPSSPPPPAHR